MAKHSQVKSASENTLYTPLQQFADTHALRYGIELMGGFYREMESANKFADTEANWHEAIKLFSKKEVK